MKKTVLSRLLCLVLLGALVFLLCACPGGGPIEPTPPPGTCEHTFNEKGICTKCGALNHTICPPWTGGGTGDGEETVYGEGALIEGAGDSIAAGASVFVPVPTATYDECTSTGVPAAVFARMALNKMSATSVFRAEGGAPKITGDNAQNTTYDGQGGAILVAEGITFTEAKELTVKNMIIVGHLTVEGEDIVFENCKIVGTVSVNGSANGVVFRDCRVEGDFAVAGNEVTILNSYIKFTENGVKATGNGLTVQNCRLEGTGTAVSINGEDCAVKYSTIALSEKDTGISFEKGTVNGFAVMNVITGAQKSVVANEAFNTVAVRNSMISAYGAGCINLYICDNELGGRVVVENNNYLLCDGNKYPSDGLDHTAVQANNQNTNGDTLTDVDARLDAGADENLLPHVNKEQFVGMERKMTVRDTENSSSTLYGYLAQKANETDLVFVAPGAYVCEESLTLQSTDTYTIYAYGVYAERPAAKDANNLATHLTLKNTKDITVKGITFGYAEQSSGQVHVLEKMLGNRVRVVTGAGLKNDFVGTNDNFFADGTTFYLHRFSQEQDYVYRDAHARSVEKKSDGTMVILLDPEVYELVEPGDVFTCRLADGNSSVAIRSTTGTFLKDLTVYGTSGGLCFWEETNLGPVTYYRVADLSRSGDIIDKPTYEKYEELEAAYTVDLGISIDQEGRYRGPRAYISSVDATHVYGCVVGSQIISCRFEDMCDDGTNQKSRHSRLADITIEGDIAIITYKGNYPVSKVSRNESPKADRFCEDFLAGERVFIYTTDGQRICDAEALTPTVIVGNYPSSYNDTTVQYRRVTVKASEVNIAPLSAYDLTDDSPTETGKVLVDNRTRASNGFLIDNTLIKNTRSRGLLLKSSFGTVKNCTFRNNAKCGIAVIFEVFWGESSVSENVVIEKNLFDNTSYSTAAQSKYRHAPLVIAGLGGQKVEEDYLLYRNIDVIGNKFVNRNIHVNTYAVYLQAVMDVEIVGNDFGEAADENDGYFSTAVYMSGARDILIEMNTYSSYATVDAVIEGEHYVNVYGEDVDGLFPDKP